MKIVTIDTETGGLVPEKASLLEIGIVLYDSEVHGKVFSEIDFNKLPSLNIRVRLSKSELMCDDFCKKLNIHLVEPIETETYIDELGGYSYYNTDDITKSILHFLVDNNFIKDDEIDGIKKSKLNILGKNYAEFDKLFLEHHIPGYKEKIISRMRKLDPSMLYTHIDDKEAANLLTCMIRSGLYSDEMLKVSHTAVQDCIDTLKVTLNKLL